MKLLNVQLVVCGETQNITGLQRRRVKVLMSETWSGVNHSSWKRCSYCSKEFKGKDYSKNPVIHTCKSCSALWDPTKEYVRPKWD